MRCPYCGKEMEVGIIQSPNEISWIKGKKKKLFSRSEFNDEAVVLSELSFVSGSAVVAHLCRDCQKILIDYSASDSDLNKK